MPILLDEIPNLKIIHLIRDPRGSLDSMARHKVHDLFTEFYCPIISEDIDQADIFKTKYPKSFISIKYEDMSLRPYGELFHVFLLFLLMHRTYMS